MRRGVSILFFGAIVFTIFSINFTSAQSCNDDQIIFRAHQQSNAHLALWNRTEYTEKVCFNHFFNGNYNGANPHNSNGANSVIRLSNFTNAHAQSNSLTTYPFIVNYGNLNCQSTTGSCSAGQCSIGFLSNNSNSHYSRTGGSGWNWRICCSSTGFTCNSAGSSCTNNIIEGNEECSGTNVNGETCQDRGFDGGTLSCDNSCNFVEDDCFDVADLTAFCAESGLNQNNETRVIIEGQNRTAADLRCNMINKITTQDMQQMNPDYTFGLNNFKEEMCNICHDELRFDICGTNEDCEDSGDARCEWDGDSCELHYTPQGTTDTCITEEISDTGCEGGVVIRTIEFETTCGTEPPLLTSEDFQCVRVVELPFFGAINFVASLLAVFAIYFVIGVLRKNAK